MAIEKSLALGYNMSIDESSDKPVLSGQRGEREAYDEADSE